VGVVGLVWAASGFFNVLAVNINRAWPKVKLRGYVQNRLVALGMIGALVGLLILSILTTTFISLLPSMFYIFGDVAWLDRTTSLVIVLRLASVFITYMTFVAMYRWVPNKDVDWSPVLRGALLATVVWETGRLLFTLYLSSGLARYQFVYGSLSALIALMVWIYFGNLITLYGAYFVATMDLRQDHQVAEEQHDVQSRQRTDWKSVKGVRG
jgi:membrane protein